jgi:hypothetical protein
VQDQLSWLYIGTSHNVSFASYTMIVCKGTYSYGRILSSCMTHSLPTTLSVGAYGTPILYTHITNHPHWFTVSVYQSR